MGDGEGETERSFLVLVAVSDGLGGACGGGEAERSFWGVAVGDGLGVSATKLNTSCVSAAQTSGGAALAFCSGSSLCGVAANLLDNTI